MIKKTVKRGVGKQEGTEFLAVECWRSPLRHGQCDCIHSWVLQMPSDTFLFVITNMFLKIKGPGWLIQLSDQLWPRSRERVGE